MGNSAGVPPSERYPLSDDEQGLWDSSVQDLMFNYQDRDPIEQAVDDHRLGHAYALLRSDTEEGRERGAELLAQISYEYILWPAELAAAMEIYSDRLHGERNQ
jgi:hypothetical protein